MGVIRIVGPGETRGYPYPVCKKEFSSTAKQNKLCLIGRKKGSCPECSRQCTFYRLSRQHSAGRKPFIMHNSLGRKLEIATSLGRKLEIADSLGGSQT